MKGSICSQSRSFSFKSLPKLRKKAKNQKSESFPPLNVHPSIPIQFCFYFSYSSRYRSLNYYHREEKNRGPTETRTQGLSLIV